MRSTFTFVAWEIWRKSRLVHFALLGLLALGGIIRIIAQFAPVSNAEALSFCGIALMLTLPALAAVFSCTDSGVQIAFPRRAFALPASTAALVNGPILLGAVAVTFFHAAWAGLFLLPRVSHYPFGEFTLLLIAAMVSFQASVWCLSGFPNLLAIELSLLGVGLLFLGIRIHEHPGDSLTDASLCLLLAVSYAAALTGVRCHRHGRLGAPISAQELMENAAAKWIRPSRLSSTPSRAQLWIERRRNAVAPFLVGIVNVVVFALFANRMMAGDSLPGGLFTVWLFFFSFVAAFWAMMSGLLLASDASSRSLSLSQFLATRPIASGDLAWAKIKLAYGLTLVGWIIYAAAAGLWVASLHQHGRWPADDEALAMGLTFCMMPWSLIGALPLWLTGRIPSVPIAGLFLMGCCIGLGNVIGYFCQHFGLYSGLVLVLLPCAFAAKIFLSAWAFAQCYRRRLLRLSQVLVSFAIWLLGTAFFLFLAFKFCPQSQIPRLIAVWLAALLFPLARISLAPLAVEAARHR